MYARLQAPFVNCLLQKNNYKDLCVNFGIKMSNRIWEHCDNKFWVKNQQNCYWNIGAIESGNDVDAKATNGLSSRKANGVNVKMWLMIPEENSKKKKKKKIMETNVKTMQQAWYIWKTVKYVINGRLKHWWCWKNYEILLEQKIGIVTDNKKVNGQKSITELYHP